MAVVRVENPPATLVPLAVIDREPAVGEKLFAIGSPSLGSAILEQTISEGILSAPARQLKGGTWLQHTAAVNPGNSGGPLLDEKGQMLGLVTLKTDLDGVGFAIPAAVIRQAFERNAK